MRRFFNIIFTCFFVVFSSSVVYAAAEAGTVLSHDVSGQDLIVFISNPSAEKEYSVDFQIGTSAPAEVDTTEIKKTTPSVETILLIDNSISIQNKYRDSIEGLLLSIIDRRIDGEVFTLAEFSDKIEILSEKNDDTAALADLVRNMEYHDQETFLTDILYEYVKELSEKHDGVFRRIVIISDGVDNKEIGYTKDELNRLLAEFPIPIYTFGCSGTDKERLKNMFALSRLTGGDSLLLDEVKNPAEGAEILKSTDTAIRARLTPQADDLDGRKKAVRVVWKDASGTRESSFETEMPFGDIVSTAKENTGMVQSAEMSATETETVQGQQETAAQQETSVQQETTQEKNAALEESVQDNVTEMKKDYMSGLKKIILIVLLAIAAGAVAVLFLNRRNRNTAPKKSKKDKHDAVEIPVPSPSAPAAFDDLDNVKTTILSDDNDKTEIIKEGDDDDRTMLFEANRQICLTEEGSGKVYEAELTSGVLAGRSTECDIQISDSSVSRRHVQFTLRGDSVYIENLSEMNGTFVNGSRISGEQLLEDGSTIGLGRVRLTVHIR